MERIKRIDSKGLELPTSALFYIFLFVAALVIVLPLVLIPKEKGTWLFDVLGGVIGNLLDAAGIGAQGNAFTRAVNCAYYRCTDGCDVAQSKAGSFDCASFCRKVPSEFKENGKICGWNAEQYPVELNGFASDAKLSKKIGDINFDCIIPSKSTAWGVDRNIINVAAMAGSTSLCAASILGLGWTGVAPIAVCGYAVTSIAYSIVTGIFSYNNLMIDLDVLSSRETTTCGRTGTSVSTITDALKSFTVDSGEKKLYIFSDAIPYDFIIHWGDRKMTSVFSVPTYLSIQQNEEKQVQLRGVKISDNKDIWNRINVEGVGDIFVEPRIGPNEGTEDIPPTGFDEYKELKVICSPGGAQVTGLSKAMCDIKSDASFCEGKFSIRCIDVQNTERLVFAVSYGGVMTGVMLFDRPGLDSSGSYITISGDDTDLRNNAEFGISSVYVSYTGKSATLYDKVNHEGKSITLAGGYYYIASHRHLGFDRATSSIKLLGTDCWAKLYDDQNYVGDVWEIYSNMADMASWNDRIRSIKVKEGCIATLYKNANFDDSGTDGYRITIAGDSSSLDFDNKAMSIKLNTVGSYPFPTPPVPPTTPTDCAGFNTQPTCDGATIADGTQCSWCPSCNPDYLDEKSSNNYGGIDKCISIGELCTYTCVKTKCGAQCILDSDCSFGYACEGCLCVPSIPVG